MTDSRSTTRPRLAVRLAVATVAIVIALGICELGARMIFPRPPDPAREPQLTHLYDPDVRYVMAPSQQGWIDDGLITVNSLGFRGKEVAIPKPPGRFRVVVIGDSLTLGWSVQDDETYAARLESLLRQRTAGRDVDVVNLGVGGYNTRQAVTWLSRHSARLQPDLVLVGFYSNDVPDALEDELSGTRIAADRPGAGQKLTMRNPLTYSWWERQLRKSRAVYVAGRALNRAMGRGEWGMSRFALELDMLAGKSSPEIDQAWGIVEQQLDRLAELARQDGFSVGLVPLPCREQVMGDYAEANFQTKVRSLAAARGFAFIDPLPLLAEHRAKITELYIPYDRNHPSAWGHALIAEAIARQVAGRVATAHPGE